MARGKRQREQRPHQPDVLGPRLIRSGRYYAADLRPWGGGRPTLRDPKHPRWPRGGERTTELQVAEKWRWAYVDDLREGVRRRQLGLPPARSRILAKAGKDWLDHREHEVEHRTWVSNRTAVNRLVEALGDVPVHTVTPEMVRDHLYAMLRAGYERSTVQTERNILSAFFRWLGMPITGVKVPMPAERDVFMWTDEELEQLRAAASLVDASREGVPVARLAVELAIASGMRQQELFAARWEDFSADAYTVRVVRQLDRYRPGETKMLKGKRGRTAVLMDSWDEWHQPGRKGWVLPRTDGKSFGYRQTSLIAQRVLDTARLNAPGRGWHTFRKTYGRLFLEGTRGSGMHLLQQSLGHKDIGTTQRIYGHLAETDAASMAVAMLRGGDGRLRVVK